jgi:hypothetical protein
MRAAQAVGKNAETFVAVREAVERCLADLGGASDLIAALAFYGADHDPGKLASALAEMLPPGVPSVGCSTDGEISSAGLSVDSVCVMLLASSKVRARAAVHPALGKGSFEAGAAIARELAAPDARVLILLPDGLTGNGSAVIRGAQEVLGPSFVIAGGTAGDRGRFVKTTQITQGQATTDALVGLMLYGASLDVGFGVMSGWKPIGIAKEVTRAEGNVVFSIEGETALEVYSTFLGDKAAQLPAIGVEYPFALVDDSGLVGERGLQIGEEYILLRAPMSVDHATGAVSFAAEIPQGAKIKMTRAKSDAIIEAAREAAMRTVKHLSGKPDAVMFFSCMARKVVLGRKTNREIEVAREIFGNDVPMIGFYTYGEIANCGEVSPMCRFHNETATFLALREST